MAEAMLEKIQAQIDTKEAEIAQAQEELEAIQAFGDNGYGSESDCDYGDEVVEDKYDLVNLGMKDADDICEIFIKLCGDYK